MFVLYRAGTLVRRPTAELRHGQVATGKTTAHSPVHRGAFADLTDVSTLQTSLLTKPEKETVEVPFVPAVTVKDEHGNIDLGAIAESEHLINISQYLVKPRDQYMFLVRSVDQYQIPAQTSGCVAHDDDGFSLQELMMKLSLF